MIKCKIKDPNSDKFLEVTVEAADVDNLSETQQAELQQECSSLAKKVARHLGYFKVYGVDDDGVVIE